jgi:hypothetical protein
MLLEAQRWLDLPIASELVAVLCKTYYYNHLRPYINSHVSIMNYVV